MLEITANMVAAACRLGATHAIEFAEFGQSLTELDDQQRKLLLRAWLALEEVPHEASLERADLLRVMTALRQAWITIKHMPPKTMMRHGGT